MISSVLTICPRDAGLPSPRARGGPRATSRDRVTPAAWLGYLFVAVLPAAALGCRSPGPSERYAPIHVYDQLEQITAGGLAEELLRGVPPGDERPVLDLDFEDGRITPLTPFAGFGVEPDVTGDFARTVSGSRAFHGGKSVELRGGVPHGVSLRTPPIPVEPVGLYRLRYRIAVEKVRGGAGVSYGAASILLYRLTYDEAQRAAATLSDPAKEEARRLPTEPDFWVGRRSGTASWSVEETTFTTGPAATHMVLSFDLSRADDDRKKHAASGTVRFDDIQLFARREPLAQQRPDLDDGAGPPHPLKISALLGHPAYPYATESRYGIASPAPSTLRFTARVPESGVLSLGYGLLRSAQIQATGAVTFAAEVTDAESAVHEVFRKELFAAHGDRWFDADVDLAAFAGQTVEITLRTTGRPGHGSVRENLLRLPEGGAVWSYPVLHGRRAGGRLIVLVAIDTLAAARCSTYGYERETTPQLTAIARAGKLYARALSPSPWTLPAFASMLTGVPPGDHQAGAVARGRRLWRRPLAPGYVTVAERLRRAGWETRGWINNPYLTQARGVAQGFTSYVDYATQGLDAAAEAGVTAALPYIDEPRGHDRFVFFHMMDPHGPYRSNDEFRRRFLGAGYEGPVENPLDHAAFQGLLDGRLALGKADKERVVEFYDSAVAFADDQLGRIFEAVQRARDHSRVALIVTSDHGEEFWEHGLFEHGHTVFDELLRVPLVVYTPGRDDSIGVVESPVSTQDIAATLLDLAELEIPESLASRSLLEPGDGAGRLFTAESTLWGVQRLAAERNRVKYIYNQLASGQPHRRSPRPATRHELYLLDRDPGELENVFAAELGRGLELHEELTRRFVSSLRGSYVIDLASVRPTPRRRLRGVLTLPPGASWDPFVRDFLWPLADGSAAPFEIKRRRVGGRAVAEFSVEASRALLAFPVRDGSGTVEIELSLDDRPVAPQHVALGESQARPEAMPATLDDEQLRISPQRLYQTPRGGPEIVIGFLAEDQDVEDEGGRGVAPDLEERLRALGYVADRGAAPRQP